MDKLFREKIYNTLRLHLDIPVLTLAMIARHGNNEQSEIVRNIGKKMEELRDALKKLENDF